MYYSENRRGQGRKRRSASSISFFFLFHSREGFTRGGIIMKNIIPADVREMCAFFCCYYYLGKKINLREPKRN